jgi:hypothetical protein
LLDKNNDHNLESLPKEIKIHIGENKYNGYQITGQEEFVLITIRGNKRSLYLDDGDKETFAMSHVVTDPELELYSFSDMIEFIFDQLPRTGDTILSMVKYNKGHEINDLVADLLIDYSTDSSSFVSDDCSKAYADLADYMGFSNMDPVDFCSDIWFLHIVRNYSNNI